jgi:cell division protein FtsL
MTPGTAAKHRSRTLRRGPAPKAPRRVSGPTRPPRAALAGAGAAVARPPLSLRLGRRAMRVGDARVLDRLVRGRAWIAIVAAALMGIVFMQVSMLKLNAGVSRAVTAADTLERQNSALRADISELDSGERIQDTAAKLGMVTPPAGNVRYLNGMGASAARAAAAIKPPKPVAPVAPTLGAAATTATPNGATATGAATAGASPSGTAANGAAATGAAATGAATPNGATVTATGAAATGASPNGAAAAGAAPSGGAGAATANGTPATQQQAPAAQQQAPAQQGTAANSAPPATSQTSPAGSVAGGATATPGEG